MTNADGSVNLAAEMAPEGGKWPHFSLAVGSKINKIKKNKKDRKATKLWSNTKLL